MTIALALFGSAVRAADTLKNDDAESKFNSYREHNTDAHDATQALQLNNEEYKTTLANEILNQKKIEDKIFSLKHKERSFNFQHIASIVIFIVVIIIVLSGILFSGMQFRHTLKQAIIKEKLLDAAKGAEGATDAFSAMKTEMEITKDGVKVNSSVLGVLILVISLAFFYMYLIYVYPIKYITPQDAQKITDVPATKVTSKATGAASKDE